MPFPSNSGSCRDIGERSITIVTVERGAQRACRFVNIRGGRLDKEEIHQAVLVIVDPTDASAHRFEVIFFFGLGGVLKEADPGCLSNVAIPPTSLTIFSVRTCPPGPSHPTTPPTSTAPSQNY